MPGDIRETDPLADVLERQAVESIIHEAAFNHVPMIGSHVPGAVRNNILATWNMVCTARRQNVRSQLVISSDKAINPGHVMGPQQPGRPASRLNAGEQTCSQGAMNLRWPISRAAF